MMALDVLDQALEVWFFSHPFQWKHAVMAAGFSGPVPRGQPQTGYEPMRFLDGRGRNGQG